MDNSDNNGIVMLRKRFVFPYEQWISDWCNTLHQVSDAVDQNYHPIENVRLCSNFAVADCYQPVLPRLAKRCL